MKETTPGGPIPGAGDDDLSGTSAVSLPAPVSPCVVAGCVDPQCLARAGHAAADRAARRRRIAAILAPRFRAGRELDRLIQPEQPAAGWRQCDGGHHPGLGCDWWSSCSGASRSYAEHKSAAAA